MPCDVTARRGEEFLLAGDCTAQRMSTPFDVPSSVKPCIKSGCRLAATSVRWSGQDSLGRGLTTSPATSPRMTTARQGRRLAPAPTHPVHMATQPGSIKAFFAMPGLCLEPPQQNTWFPSNEATHECSHPTETPTTNLFPTPFASDLGTDACPAKLAPQQTTRCPVLLSCLRVSSPRSRLLACDYTTGARMLCLLGA